MAELPFPRNKTLDHHKEVANLLHFNLTTTNSSHLLIDVSNKQ